MAERQAGSRVTIGDVDYCSVNRRLIMSEHLNAAGRLFGGQLMGWVDESAALYCMDQMGTGHLVTKKISEVIFNEPGYPGDVLEFLCRITRAGRTSLSLECLVMTRPFDPAEDRRLIVSCELVFVALDRNGRPATHRLSTSAS